MPLSFLVKIVDILVLAIQSKNRRALVYGRLLSGSILGWSCNFIFMARPLKLTPCTAFGPFAYFLVFPSTRFPTFFALFTFYAKIKDLSAAGIFYIQLHALSAHHDIQKNRKRHRFGACGFATAKSQTGGNMKLLRREPRCSTRLKCRPCRHRRAHGPFCHAFA